MTKILKDTGVDRIGKIPSDRKVMRVKNIFFRRKEVNTETDPVVLSLARAGVKVRDISNNEGQLAESYDDYHRVYKNDLMINPMDLYSGANCSISNVEGVISPAYINLASNKKIDARYFDYYFKNQYRVGAMFIHGKGVSFDNRWTINSDTMMNYYIPVPSYEEQKKISDYLDSKCNSIDFQKEKYTKSLDLLKQYKQALITEIIIKGLNKNVKMKASGVDWLSEIPEHRILSPFTKQLESIVDYRGKTPEKVDDGIFLVTAKNIKDGKIDYDVSKEYVKESDYDDIMHRGNVEIGDVLFTTEAPLGEVANADKTDFALAQRIIKFRGKKGKLDNYYLKYRMLTTSFQDNLHSFSTGSTAGGIKASKLGRLKVLVPPIKEQLEIVKYLNEKCSHLDSLISCREQVIDKLEEYKKSLIYEYVTGKKEVD